MFQITKICKFDSAHFLPDYNGKCKNMHGHTWKVEITLERNHLDAGFMVMDFHILDKIITEQVLNVLDHQTINYVIPYPTAELIAKWVYEKMVEGLSSIDTTINLVQVKIWESETANAVYKN